MDEGQVAQGTLEWKESRKGFITSSALSRLMTKPKLKADIDAGNLSVGAKTYIEEVVASEISIPFELNTEAVTWGKSNEALARHFYEKKTGLKVSESGFIVSEIDGFGGSPDGITVSGNGILEIKAPYSPGNHIKYCLITKPSDIPDEYYWQMMGNMYACNAYWCDFVSFDPRIDNEIGLFIYRLIRKEQAEDEERMIAKIKKGIEYKNEIKKRLNLI
jgi:putative phage-type endonuclease